MTDEQSEQDTPDTGVFAGQGGSENEPAGTEAASNESTQDGNEQSTEDSSETERDWKAEADKWRELSRKHERNAKGAKAAREEAEQLREQVANADVAAVEAASSLAAERLHTRLARAGMAADDANALVEHIDPLRLMDDGAPSSEAIDQVANTLTRTMARPTVDSDQGQRSAEPTESPDDWLRRKARK